MSDERHGESSLLVGLALGAVLGLGAGILLAPKSGAETRRILRERGEILGDQLQDAAHEGRAALAKTVEEGQRAIKELLEEGKKALADLQVRRGGAHHP